MAFCVSAYNEAAVIVRKAENMLALRAHTSVPVDLLVYVDAATDGTAALLAPYCDRIRVVVGTERHGKSHGMNMLAELAADADVLVFSDANVIVAPDALERMRAHFADAEVGCVCGHLDYVNGEDSATAAVGASYWALEERIKQAESDTGCVIGADGSLFGIRRSLHRPVPPDIIDDFYLSLSIMCDGHRVVRAGDVRATEHSATDSADEFRRKVRIACQSANVHRLMAPRLATLPWSLRFKYVGHKLLRWLTLPLMMTGGAFALTAAALLAGPAAAAALLVLGGAAVTAVLTVPALRRGREILLALTATMLGLVRSLRGDRFQTWTPPDCRPREQQARP